MSYNKLKLENTEISDFNPSLLEKGQEVIFTLKDSNILDNNQNNPNISEIKDNLQMNEINYEKNTGIAIDRLDENEYLSKKNEKLELELKEDGQIIDGNILLNKFNKIQNKYQNKISNSKKRFQNEFYSEEELKFLNKKKNRKKKNTNMVLFDIDINEENNEDNNNENKKEEKEKNEENKNNKKSLFTSEDKERLTNLFNKNYNKEATTKKNVININENLPEEENNNNINNTSKDKNYKIIDDYEIFLNNLPIIKDPQETNKINNKNTISENNKEIINTKKETLDNIISEKDEETTINNNNEEEENIPLITDEPIIGKGVCVALQIFKNKKMLKKEEEEFGRYHDKKYKNIT